MLNADDAQMIVDEFDLGPHGVLDGPVARGEVGQLWRLTTPDAIFALKEPFERPKESASDDEAIFQELGVANGVPAPRIVRTGAGRVIADVRSVAIRVYEWVELCAPDRNLEFAGHDAQRASEIYSSYRESGGPGLVDRRQCFSMVIAQLGHIGYHSARRWLDDPDEVERERNAGRVAEFLDDGLTLNQIDLLLDAIAE